MGSVSKVYFTRNISAEQVVKLYELLGKKLEGRIAVKVHSGEKGNQNYLKPEFWKPVVEHVGGTVVECNTAYEGERNSTDKHTELIKEHGWNDLFTVDLMDAYTALGEIIGEAVSEDLINEIFSEFCMGK